MGAWVDVFGVGGRVLAVVYDLVDKILGEDNGLNFPPEGLLEYVLLGEVNGLVCIVGCIEFRLCGQEYIIRDAFEGVLVFGCFFIEFFIDAEEVFFWVLFLHGYPR